MLRFRVDFNAAIGDTIRVRHIGDIAEVDAGERVEVYDPAEDDMRFDAYVTEKLPDNRLLLTIEWESQVPQ